MSLLLASGHVNAERYTLGRVMTEALIVNQRQAQDRLQDTLIMKSIVSSLFGGESQKNYEEHIKKLSEDAEHG